MKNWFRRYLRRYGKTKKFRLPYKVMKNSLIFVVNGLKLIENKHYTYNQKENLIELTFMPDNRILYLVEGIKK